MHRGQFQLKEKSSVMNKPLSEEEFVAQQTSELYKMKCFDTMVGANDLPIVTRVPGGWVWCIASGGARLETSGGHLIIGNQVLSTVFVPYSEEFDKSVFAINH
jgi:hypothetical protein